MRRHVISLVVLLLCAACSRETGGRDGGRSEVLSRGVMQVEVEKNDAMGADRINTIRLIVFTDLDAARPKAEINDFYGAGDFVVAQPGGANAASKVKVVLQVERRKNRPNDKLVVAIVNEPAAMRGDLDAVATPQDLERLELDMAHFVADDHLSLKPDSLMPMSGAVWTSDSHIHDSQAEAAAHSLALVVQRAVARIDLYINTDIPGGTRAGIIESNVALVGTYTKSRLVHHRDDRGHELGSIQTVAEQDLQAHVKHWMLLDAPMDIPYHQPADPDAPSSVLLCTFYTPERNCLLLTQRPILAVTIDTPEGAKIGNMRLETASSALSGEQPIEAIRRNNIYRVTITVRATDIAFDGRTEVLEWNRVAGAVPLPGQYRLSVDKARLEFPYAGGTQSIAVDTDYPTGWAVDRIGNLPAGITLVRRSATRLEVTAAPKAPGAPASQGSFTIRAGNLSKTIEVAQAFVPWPDVPTSLLAPPGVLGVTESGELTLRGSREYAGTPVEWDSEFGALHEQTVYVAQFLWGSRVALSSRDNGVFSADDVLWAPGGYLYGIKASMGTSTGGAAWGRIPYVPQNGWPSASNEAIGDPCPYATIDADKNLAALYHVPDGKIWNNMLGLAPATLTLANGKQVEGRYDASVGKWDMFVPYAGVRGVDGAVVSTTHLYASRTREVGNNYYLFMRTNLVRMDWYATEQMATPIRCVR